MNVDDLINELTKSYGVPSRETLLDVAHLIQKYRVALVKIADPRKRDHQEPDPYTTVGCLMHIANEALNKP